MEKPFKIVKVDSEYCNYLRNYDNRIMYNEGTKELRPFVGILFIVDKMEYYAPLSSPKPKHKNLKNTLDLVKIKDGTLGVVNINNMIPITKYNYEFIDLNKKHKNINEYKRNKLLILQLRWLNSNREQIKQKTTNLYKLYKNNILPENVKNRCCNFPLLEKKCKKYNKTSIFARIRMYF